MSRVESKRKLVLFLMDLDLTNIVCHVADDKACEIEQNGLHVNGAAILDIFDQLRPRTRICFRKDIIDHGLQIASTEELEASFPLCFPKLAGGIDNAMTCEILDQSSATYTFIPKRSLDRSFTKGPLETRFSFLRTNSRLAGLEIMTPGGRVGTLSSSVSKPYCLCICTNQPNNSWRGRRMVKA